MLEAGGEALLTPYHKPDYADSPRYTEGNAFEGLLPVVDILGNTWTAP